MKSGKLYKPTNKNITPETRNMHLGKAMELLRRIYDAVEMDHIEWVTNEKYSCKLGKKPRNSTMKSISSINAGVVDDIYNFLYGNDQHFRDTVVTRQSNYRKKHKIPFPGPEVKLKPKPPKDHPVERNNVDLHYLIPLINKLDLEGLKKILHSVKTNPRYATVGNIQVVINKLKNSIVDKRYVECKTQEEFDAATEELFKMFPEFFEIRV
jgi:hypothetical protein